MTADETAPGVGERLAAFTLPGLVCGMALQRLGALLDVPGGSHDLEIPVAAGMCALAVATSLWVLLTASGRRTLVATYALLAGIAAGALFAWQALGASGGAPTFDRSWSGALACLALFSLLFVTTPFFETWLERRERARTGLPARDRYESLLVHAWGQIGAGSIGVAFAGAVMLLLVFAVALLEIVGLDLKQVLTDERVMVPVALAALATAVGTARARSAVLETFRSLALALLRILLPVHLALVLVLLGAVGLWGLDALDTGSSPAAMLLIAAGLAVAIRSAFVGPRVATGAPDLPTTARATSMANRALAATVSPLVALAGWALWLRVDAEGWTRDRVTAAALVAVGAAYGLGYLASAVAPRPDTVLRPVNVACAGLVACASMVLLTPLLDGDRIGVASQLARAEAAGRAPDLAYLAFESGPHGRAAVAALEVSAGEREPAFAARLEVLREASDRREFDQAESVLERTDDRAAAVRAGTLDVVARAAGTTRSADPDELGVEPFREAADAWLDSGVGARLCLAAGARCLVLSSDESPLPGAPRLIVFAVREGPERVLVGWAGEKGEPGEIRRLVLGTGIEDEPEPFDAPEAEIDALFERMAAGELPLVLRETPVFALGDAVAVPGRARRLETGR